MPEGHYASYVAFGTSTKEEYEMFEQTNNYQGSLFSCNFTDVLQDLDNEDHVITMHVTLSLHTYNIDVLYGIINPKGPSVDNMVEFPNMTLTFDDSDITPKYLENKVVFEGIAYGKTVNINVDDIITGLTSAGWYEENGEPSTQYQHNSRWIEIKNVTANKVLCYNLQYESYDIVLNVASIVDEFGTPIPAKNHNFEEQYIVKPTCKTEGQAQKVANIENSIVRDEKVGINHIVNVIKGENDLTIKVENPAGDTKYRSIGIDQKLCIIIPSDLF